MSGDMTRTSPITQVEVEMKMLDLIENLETETENFEGFAVRAATTEAAFKKAWASEYIANEGSIKAREAWADYKTEAHRHKYLVAEALMRSQQQKLTTIRTQLDSLRTIAANVRSSV